jgi:hypothetical protein
MPFLPQYKWPRWDVESHAQKEGRPWDQDYGDLGRAVIVCCNVGEFLVGEGGREDSTLDESAVIGTLEIHGAAVTIWCGVLGTEDCLLLAARVSC